ncbi:phage tail sheath family protein [Gorillibacterium sp. sgz5001074]|uniref:phage tail sheath family protein n=1 Tax=Gorillibacterium sp. sgz5001074 TaxID=3446695 RepID=UPI003F663D53
MSQNKARPGVYINTINDSAILGSAGERGVAALPLSLSWGTSKKIISLTAADDFKTVLGYDLTAPQLLLVKEALKRAHTLLVYRLNTGTKAKATVGTLTATAKHGGVRGNDLKVVVQVNVDDSAKFDVKTLVGNNQVEVQTVSAIEGLIPNGWVDFSGTGALTATAGAPLTGGADGTVTNSDYTDFLSALELFEFDTVGLCTTDNTLKSVFTAFVRRLREEEGRKIQAVLENYPAADYEGIISVKNGVLLSDGTTLGAAQAVAWVTGATAAAAVDESLTYTAYEDAIDVNPRYTNSQIINALRNGELLFTLNDGRAVVEQDINSLKSFTPAKGKTFAKNRTLRVLDGISKDLKRTYERYFIGKVDNNEDGRNLFRKECITYMEGLQNRGAIQNFDAQKDVTVSQGVDSDAVFAEAYAQPVDSIEKIYMNIKVQ